MGFDLENEYRNMFPTDGRSLRKNKTYNSTVSRAIKHKGEKVFSLFSIWFQFDTQKNIQTNDLWLIFYFKRITSHLKYRNSPLCLCDIL